MTDMMRSTTVIFVLVAFLLVVVIGLFITLRVVGERANASEAPKPPSPPAERG